ncbi:E3 ubiquitin-protein ligase TRIM56-like [Ylistrum balloti]|uniref:E3 ubiquitin-protein ligase TRIM56-like n=1 Tax=Ylistrum balloti TaxID=509963 RepID=UPI002905EA52|nr:E3 ubiquitin-protein ligase TRIM56-like [Ylistrum balloti]
MKTQDSNGRFSCFICHAVFGSDDERRSVLNRNTYISRLVELHLLKTDKHICIVCRFRDVKKNATHYCVDCGDMLCNKCAEHHTFTRLTFNHQVIKRKDLKAGKNDDIILKNRLFTCGDHPDTQIQYFCRSCPMPVCEQCLVSHGNDHKIITKQEALKTSKRKDIDRMFTELQPCLRQAMTVQQFVENGIQEIEKKEVEIPKKVQSLCDKLKTVIDQKGKEAKEMASSELADIKQKLTTQKVEVAAYLEKIEPSLELCETLICGANALHILPIEDLLLKKLSSLTAIDRPSDCLETQSLDVKFQTSLMDSICLANLTSIEFRQIIEEDVTETNPVPSPPEINQSKSDEQKKPILVKCSDQSQNSSKTTQPKITTHAKSNKSKDTKTKQFTSGKKQAGLDASRYEDKKEVLHSQNKTSIQTLAANVKPLTITTENDLSKSNVKKEEDVKLNPSDKIIASGSAIVNRYQQIRCFSLDTPADTLKPMVTSVAWVNSNSFVVSDRDNNKISVFNIDGTVEWSAPVDSPLNVACAKDVVACSRRGYITLFRNKTRIKDIHIGSNNITPLLTGTVDETFLGTTSHGRNSMATFTTSGQRGTAIQVDGCNVNLISSNNQWHIISDWSMNSLLFIDKTSGQICKETCLPEPRKWGHHGGHCTDENCVLVADYHGNKVIVLSNDGKYLHSWSLPSAIYHPCDLDFHSSGQLIVTSNKQVAIFTTNMKKQNKKL